MTTHTLKLPEPYFSAVLSGEKTFEARRNDRGFQRGDTLVLVDTSSCGCGSDKCDKRRPPIVRQVSFVFAGDPSLRDLGGIVPGYVVLALSTHSTDPVAEMSMHCGFDGPHSPHTWQMSATGYCDCPGNPLTTQPTELERAGSGDASDSDKIQP